MPTIRVNSDNVNIRSTPDMRGLNNILLNVPSGRVFYNAELVDGWYEFPVYIHSGTVSVISSSEIPQGSVPYRSQWDVDANNRTADCGQTCVAMLAQWKGKTIEINDLRFQSASSGLSTASDLVKNFQQVQLQAQAQVVDDYKEAKLPAICLIRYGGLKREHIQDKRYFGWHWVVLLKIDDATVTVHDPNYWGGRRHEGAFKQYNKDEWRKAFVPYPNTAGLTLVTLIDD